MVLYYGGDILTMVGDSPTYAEAVVEKDGIIIFTGSFEKAREKYPDVRLKNLNGLTMMPGLIDPHLHPSMASLILRMSFITPFDWKLPSGNVTGVRTKEEYRTNLGNLIKNFTPSVEGEFLITWGYHNSFHGEMNRKVMDDICGSKEIPLVVWQRSFHEVYLNSVALNTIKYQDFGKIEECDQVNLEEGHFLEMGLDLLLSTTSFVDQVFPRMEAGYKDVVDVVHHGGITTIADLEFPMFDEEKEKDMVNGLLKLPSTRFSTYCVPSSRNYGRDCGSHENAVKHIKAFAEEFSDDKVILYDNHVKCLIDGAFFSQAMQMKIPYTDQHVGEWITPPEDLKPIMEVYWRNGFQIHIHTNGDLGMEEVLNIIEELNDKLPRSNHRTTIEHAGYFTEDQADRIAKLGVLVSAAPYYLYSLGEKYSKDGLGPDRAEAIAPLKWLFDRGVPTALHSDFTMAPSQPLLLAWVAVNRLTAENNLCFREDLKITPYQGMLGITRNAAIILGTLEIMGTIEAGKYANFTLLKENPLKIDAKSIKDIEVYGTVYKGTAKVLGQTNSK